MMSFPLSIGPVIPLANFVYSFKESNLPGQAIVVILFLGSILTWTVMVTKWVELSRARNQSARFLLSFRKEPNVLVLFLRHPKHEDSPLRRIYEKGCSVLAEALDAPEGVPGELFVGDVDMEGKRLTSQKIERVRSATDQTLADQLLAMEHHMAILSIAVAASPFLGLLGTVWGVMEAFTGMASTGSATLSAVAPGISAALLTTVVGLLVALPSTIGYNMLTERIRVQSVQMDNFAQEFMSEVENTYSTPTP